MKRILCLVLTFVMLLTLAAASAEDVTLRMAVGYNNANTGLAFSPDIAGDGITLADGHKSFADAKGPPICYNVIWSALATVAVQKHRTNRRAKMDRQYYTTIGMDVSDRKTQICVMAKAGATPKIVMETAIPTTKEGLAKFLSTQDRSAPVAFETGMHCRWMNEVAEGMGFKAHLDA